MVNCSPGRVIIFICSWMAKSPNCAPLHLHRLQNIGCKLGILGEFESDLLDQLPRLVEIAVIGDADGQLVDDPIPAHVLDGAQPSERYGIERPAMMAQLDRAQAEGFDGPLVAAALDVLADAERIVEQVEHAADHVAHDSLGAEADRHSSPASP
jgi:hypothetical protein